MLPHTCNFVATWGVQLYDTGSCNDMPLRCYWQLYFVATWGNFVAQFCCIDLWDLLKFLDYNLLSCRLCVRLCGAFLNYVFSILQFYSILDWIRGEWFHQRHIKKAPEISSNGESWKKYYVCFNYGITKQNWISIFKKNFLRKHLWVHQLIKCSFHLADMMLLRLLPLHHIRLGKKALIDILFCSKRYRYPLIEKLLCHHITYMLVLIIQKQ